MEKLEMSEEEEEEEDEEEGTEDAEVKEEDMDEEAGGGGGSRRRSRGEEEKERTKMRERQRRAITGRILGGLRKQGNYKLRVRADINEVIAALAREAGWVVMPDGTTFPSSSSSQSQSQSQSQRRVPPVSPGTSPDPFIRHDAWPSRTPMV